VKLLQTHNVAVKRIRYTTPIIKHIEISQYAATTLAQHKYMLSKNSCIGVREKHRGIVQSISMLTLPCNVLHIEYDAEHRMEM